jgi:hypothetical protein
MRAISSASQLETSAALARAGESDASCLAVMVLSQLALEFCNRALPKHARRVGRSADLLGDFGKRVSLLAAHEYDLPVGGRQTLEGPVEALGLFA